MIKLENINVTFNRGTILENKVLSSFNLEVGAGEFITIIGGNGAGKSTLVNLIAGEVTPDSGQIMIDQIDVTSLPPDKRTKYIARVFQDPMIGTCAALTIEENLCLAFTRGQNRNFAMAINNTIRQEFKHRLAKLSIGLENRLQDQVSLLSGGQRQALSLVMASLAPSKILLLDEHTAALDPKMAALIMQFTKQIVDEYQLTTLMITHSMSQALEYGTRSIMMYHGKIVQDLGEAERKLITPAELIKYFDL